LSEIRGLRLPPPAAHRDRDRTRSFRCKRQPPRRCHRKPCDLGDHGTKSTVTNAFLETCEHRFFVAGVDVDDPVRGETDLGERRREQILPSDAPEDLAFRARRDAGGEQGGRCAVDGGVATSRHFVQSPTRQAAARKAAVDCLDAERQYGPDAQLGALKALNLLTKPQDGGWLDRSSHALVKRFQD
jgi:hypothetical protein